MDHPPQPGMGMDHVRSVGGDHEVMLAKTEREKLHVTRANQTRGRLQA